MSRRTLPCDPGSFLALIGAVLPMGGALVALVEAHFDESIGEKPRRILCVAGYLMTDRMARRLTREWSAVLAKYSLPYFRMSACAHGAPPFDKLSRDQRVEIEKTVIEITKRRTIKGLGVAVDLDEYETFMPKHELIGGAYTFCAHILIGGVGAWIAGSNYEGDVAYFFESGHRSQREAGDIMKKVFSDPELKRSQRYLSHTFVDKAKSPPTQAADLLAWHTYTDFRRVMEGRPRRKDFAALLRLPDKDYCVHFSREKMRDLSELWLNGGPTSLARLYLGDPEQ